MPPRPDHNVPQPTDDLAQYDQRLAKLRDEVSRKSAVLERSLARAHYLMGEIVLKNPEMYASVRPYLGPHLAKLGSARKVVDDYLETATKLERLKNLPL